MGGLRWIVCVSLLGVLLPLPSGAEGARTWQQPLQLSAPGAETWAGATSASLDVTPDGTVTAAWREGTINSSEIRVARQRRDGTLLGPQTLGPSRHLPAVATPADGHAYVAWVAHHEGSRGPLYVAELNETGGSGPPILLAANATPTVAIAANDGGEAVVMFGEGSARVNLVRRTESGEWLEARPVPPPYGEQLTPGGVGISDTGEAVLALRGYSPVGGGTSLWTAYQERDGEVTGFRQMDSVGTEPVVPSLDVNRAGAAVVSWLEMRHHPFVGDVHAALRNPGGPFDDPTDLGGSTTEVDPIRARIGESGRAVVTWDSVTRNGDGGSGGPLKAAFGSTPSGAFTPPENVSTSWLVDGSIQLALDPTGNAIFFFEDWDTRELRVVRRSAGGLYGQERALLPCPLGRPYGKAAAVDPLGNASLLYNDAQLGTDAAVMRLVRDRPSADFEPDPCPTRPPPLVWTPKDPAPGDQIALDGSGFRDPYVARTTFQWDLDGDGDFDTPETEDPLAVTSFATPGPNHLRVRVGHYAHTPGNSTHATCHYTINVGSPPQPPNEFPTYWSDPPPPDYPDEDPWPVGSRFGAPPVANPALPNVPIDPGFGFPGPNTLEPVLGGGQNQQVRTPTLHVRAPASIKSRTLVAGGLPVQVTTRRNGNVRLRLLKAVRDGVAPAHKSLLGGPDAIRVRKGRPTAVRVELTPLGRRKVRARKVRSLTLEVTDARDGTSVRQTVRVR